MGRYLSHGPGVAVGADPVSRLSAFALARLAKRSALEGRSNAGLWRAMAARAVEVAILMGLPAIVGDLFLETLEFRPKGLDPPPPPPNS